MNSTIFRCLACRGEALVAAEDGFACADCTAQYPVRNGVPLFLSGCRTEPSGLQLDDATCTRLAECAGIPPGPGVSDAVRTIFATNYLLSDFGLSAENNYYFQRVRLDGPVQRPTLSAQAAGLPVNEGVRCRFERHHVPPLLPAGTETTRNVRLVNTGEVAISSQHAPAVHLCYRWRTEQGRALRFSRPRVTKLPVPLLPGRALTVPLTFDTPPLAGAYFLEFGLVREGSWLEGTTERAAVRTVAAPGRRLPPGWEIVHRQDYDYQADHRDAAELLARSLPAPLPPGFRVLEVGGCCAPTSEALGAEVWNIDIDVQTLQLGRLRAAREAPVHFLACDAGRLPFRDGSFDAVVAVAAFHHLADPLGCLREFRRVARADGLIFFLCDPVGSYHADTLDAGMRAELEAGINEQVYLAEEYAEMFRQAGLFTRRVRIDGASLKAVLGADAPAADQAPGAPLNVPPDVPDFRGMLRWNARWLKHRVVKRLLALVRRKAG